MSEPVITIHLTPDVTAMSEALAQVQQEAKDTFANAVVASVDKAQKKLYELNRDLQNHNSIIQQNKQSIENLDAARAKAGTVELARIEAQIKALETLNRHHQNEMAGVEAKKVKQESLIAATKAASEQEKLGIQLTSQERLIEIGIIRDAQKAREIGADAAVRAAERELKSIQAAADAQQNAAEKAQKAAEKQQAAAQKAADKQQTAAQKAADAAQRDNDKQLASVEALTSRQEALTKAISAEEIVVMRLRAERAEATIEERKALDATTEQVRKVQADQQREILIIEQKKLKIEEERALTQAASDAERQAIKAAYQERQAGLEIQKSVITAQKDTNEATDTGTSSIENYVKGWMGMQGVMKIIQLVNKEINEQEQILIRTGAAYDHLRDSAEQLHQLNKTFNSAFGLMDQTQQAGGAQVLIGMSERAAAEAAASGGKRGGYIDVTETGQTMAAIQPTLQQIGHGNINDTTAQDFGTKAEFLRQNGFAPDAINALLLNKHDSPEAFMQAGMNLRATTGSSSGASAFLQQFGDKNKASFSAVGLGYDDALKMFMSAKKSGLSDSAAGEAISKSARGFDRLMTLDTDKKVVEEYHQLRNLGDDEKTYAKRSEHFRGTGSDARKFEMLKGMGKGTHAFDQVFQDRLSGKLDNRGFAAAVTAMYPHLSEADKIAIGGETGSRAIASNLAIGDYTQQQLQTAGADSLHGDTSNAQAAATTAAMEKSRQAIEMPTNVQNAMRSQYIEDRGKTLADTGGSFDYKNGSFGNTAKRMLSFGLSYPTDDERKSIYGLSAYTIRIAKEREAAAAKGAPKEVLDKYDEVLRQSGEMLGAWMGKGQKPLGKETGMEAIIRGSNSSGATRASELAKYDTEMATDPQKGEAKYIGENTDFQSAHSIWKKNVEDPNKLNDVFKAGTEAEQTERRQPARPAPPATPKAGPVSVNYHIRQVNYGMSYDQIGAPETQMNNFG